METISNLIFFFILMTINISVTRAVIPSRLPQQLHYSSDRRCRVRNAKLCIFLSFFFYRESEFLPRWEQVLEELKTKGIYDLTFDELEFGVRTAWRNAARCSARIQWENLVSINQQMNQIFFKKKKNYVKLPFVSLTIKGSPRSSS